MEEKILPDVKDIKTQETYTLPSKGLAYSESDGIPSAITLRRMTTKEDKIRMRNESDDRIRKDLLQACIVEPIDAGKLKLLDANYLLFRLRSISLLNDIYKVECRCKYCGTNFIHEVNLSDVPVKYLTKEAMKKMKLELPISKAKLDFKFPSLNDMIRMSDGIADYFAKFPTADRGEVLYTLSLMLYLDKVNGHTLLSEEKENYIDSLDLLDSRAIRDNVNGIDLTFGFTDILKTKCPNCEEEVEHTLPITSELFSPSK